MAARAIVSTSAFWKLALLTANKCVHSYSRSNSAWKLLHQLGMRRQQPEADFSFAESTSRKPSAQNHKRIMACADKTAVDRMPLLRQSSVLGPSVLTELLRAVLSPPTSFCPPVANLPNTVKSREL